MAETALPTDTAFAQERFQERFSHRLEPELNTGCLLWSGSTSTAGYGTLTWAGKSRLAHRCSYEDQHGAGSAFGLVVRHKCDTPSCVNPGHLLIGTQADNSEDARVRGRLRPALGEASGKAKFTERQILSMRRMASNGAPISEIARHFGAKFNSVDAAVRGISWPHLPGAVQRPNKARIPGSRPGQGARKVSAETASEIKARAARGERTKDIAGLFGISVGLVSAIKHGRIWKHV